MTPRETENNAYAKFWGDKQRALWYVMVFLEWSNIDDPARPEENDIRRNFLSDEGAAFTLLFLFDNGHGLLSSLLGARRSFLPEGYHHEGVECRSLQVQT